MMDDTIVPHDEITLLPMVSVNELGLDDVIGKLLDKREGFLVWHVSNTDTFTFTNIKAFLS
jgi:hypothetical protein